MKKTARKALSFEVLKALLMLSAFAFKANRDWRRHAEHGRHSQRCECYSECLRCLARQPAPHEGDDEDVRRVERHVHEHC